MLENLKSIFGQHLQRAVDQQSNSNKECWGLAYISSYKSSNPASALSLPRVLEEIVTISQEFVFLCDYLSTNNFCNDFRFTKNRQTNWRLIRLLSKYIRYEKSCFIFIIDLQLFILLKLYQRKDGFIKDSFFDESLNYNLFNNFLLSLILSHRRKLWIYRFVRTGYDFVTRSNEVFDGITYKGRGQGQIFGYVSGLACSIIVEKISSEMLTDSSLNDHAALDSSIIQKNIKIFHDNLCSHRSISGLFGKVGDAGIHSYNSAIDYSLFVVLVAHYLQMKHYVHRDIVLDD